MKVYCITYCMNADLLYGSTLFFSTIRVGFPNAEIIVIDNASVASVRDEIKRQTELVGGTHRQMESSSRYYEILNEVVRTESGTMAFIDPDMAFWKNCEGFKFGGLLAGRFTPKFYNSIDVIEMPRIHTSFMWIPSAEKLSAVLEDPPVYGYGFHDPVTIKMDVGWVHYDTGSTLYAGFSERLDCFTESELDCYDHIFAGSYADFAISEVHPEKRERFAQIHEWAQTDIPRLRGIWREQEDYFNSRLVD